MVEDHIMNTASSLVNRSYLDEVWNIAVPKIASDVRTHSVNIFKFLLISIILNYFTYRFLVLLHGPSPYAKDQEPGHAL